ncbi:hypothetical protein [Catellatospora paridis]|uniref:hypothetical protein n=1 Tax=Catellatospora paridis TaxID=1617086 RepID=UPI0012D472D3|nr:hypothetical protein [Catellatospora paridis]
MSDQLHRLLSDASRQAQARLRPLGAEAARRTLHRRRVARASTLAAVLAVLIVVGLNHVRGQGPPVLTTGCAQAVRPRITNATLPGPATLTFTLASADLARLCADQRLRISWATYRMTFEMRQVLVDSGTAELSAAEPTATGSLSAHSGCQADRYFHLGDHTFPAEIVPDSHLSLPAWSAGQTTGVFEQHYLPQDGCGFW